LASGRPAGTPLQSLAQRTIIGTALARVVTAFRGFAWSVPLVGGWQATCVPSSFLPQLVWPSLRLPGGRAAEMTAGTETGLPPVRRHMPVRAVPRRHRPEGRWCCGTPLLGFVLNRPSTGINAPCHFPAGPRKDLPSAWSCQAPCSFRPCRSSRLRRFPPLRAVQVCCTLQPVMGFARFRVRVGALPKVGVRAVRPRWRLPFEAFPSLAASPR